MSLASWKEEFYSTPAKDFKGVDDPERATRHSLRKWRGLRTVNLEEHGVAVHGQWGKFVGEAPDLDENIIINADSCALCESYYNEANRGNTCSECLLAKARDGVRCDRFMPDEDRHPWAAFKDNLDPEPMIDWLQKALEFVQESKVKKEPELSARAIELIEAASERLCVTPLQVGVGKVVWPSPYDAAEEAVIVFPGIITAKRQKTAKLFQILVDLANEFIDIRKGHNAKATKH